MTNEKQCVKLASIDLWGLSLQCGVYIQHGQFTQWDMKKGPVEVPVISESFSIEVGAKGMTDIFSHFCPAEAAILLRPDSKGYKPPEAGMEGHYPEAKKFSIADFGRDDIQHMLEATGDVLKRWHEKKGMIEFDGRLLTVACIDHWYSIADGQLEELFTITLNFEEWKQPVCQ